MLLLKSHKLRAMPGAHSWRSRLVQGGRQSGHWLRKRFNKEWGMQLLHR